MTSRGPVDMTGGAAQPGSVDYVVVAYRSAEHLAACLDSIAADRSAGSRVLVVDNASPDASGEVARRHPVRPLVLVSQENRGFGGGCNLAADTSTAEFLFFVNPDARLRPGVTGHLLAAMADARLGAVGPRIEDPVRAYSAAAAGFEPSIRSVLGHFLFLGRVPLLGRGFPPLQLAGGTASRMVDWVSGAALFVRTQAFRSAGGFDAAIFMYMEDVDLCRRLRSDGWTIRYDTAAVVLHALGGSQGPEQVVRWYEAFHAYLVRRHGLLYARIADAVAAAGLGLRALLLWPIRRAHSRRLAMAGRVALRLALRPRHATIPAAGRRPPAAGR